MVVLVLASNARMRRNLVLLAVNAENLLAIALVVPAGVNRLEEEDQPRGKNRWSDMRMRKPLLLEHHRTGQ